jgi:hypothetical protein
VVEAPFLCRVEMELMQLVKEQDKVSELVLEVQVSV